MTDGGPLTIFVKTSGYFHVMEAILKAIHAEAPRDLATFVRAGTLPFHGNETVAATYSAYVENVGRTLTSEAFQPPMARERKLRSRIFQNLVVLLSAPGFSNESMLKVDFECISFSNVSAEFLEVLITNLSISNAVLLIARFDPNDPLQYTYLWNSLPLRLLVLQDRLLLKPLDYPPDEVRFTMSGRPTFTRPGHLDHDQFAAGTFHVLGDEDRPAIEESFTDFTLPDVIPEPRKVRQAYFLPTPTRRALQFLERTTTRRPSVVDSAENPAHTISADAYFQFPDPENVRQKVKDYCLSRKNTKWGGFALAGYDDSRFGDAELLTHSLCSALYGQFEAYDVRTTADGTTQFSANVLLPSRRGGYVMVMTAWHFSQTKSLSLATAFVSKDLASCNPTQTLKAASLESAEKLWAEITERACRYGELVSADEEQVRGWLWVEIESSKSRPLLKQVSQNGDAGVMRRLEGKRHRQVLLPGPSVLGVTQMVGALRQAQILLGISGIRSKIEIYPT